jgi:hypothetical protein
MKLYHQWWLASLIFIFAIVGFLAAVSWQSNHPIVRQDEELTVVPPPLVQVLLAFGDRYLAADIAVVRSLLNPLKDDGYDHFRSQAKIQLDASMMNPRHEDNYYIAAALLSWSGHVEEAKTILRRAAEGRSFDMLPPLYLGFDYFYFEHDSILGANWMYQAALRADSEQNRTSLSRIASRWLERGEDAREALKVLDAMRTQARGVALKAYLAQRGERLKALVILQDSARAYYIRFGKPLGTIDDLLKVGILTRLPLDPAQLGFYLDASGMPQLRQPPFNGAPPPR